MFMWVDVSVWLFWLLRCLPSLEYDDLIYSCLEELKALNKKNLKNSAAMFLPDITTQQFHRGIIFFSLPTSAKQSEFAATVDLLSWTQCFLLQSDMTEGKKTSSKEKSAFLSNCNYLKKETLFLNICIKRVSRSYIMFKRKQHLNSHQSGQGR